MSFPRKPTKLIFLCAGNSSLDRIAEGLAQKFFGPGALVKSEGPNSGRSLHPWEIKILEEVGIDIQKLSSKEIPGNFFTETDFVITIGSDEASLKYLEGAKRHLHWNILDPADDPEHAKIEMFRHTRDTLGKMIKSFGREYGCFLTLRNHWKLSELQ